MSPMAKALLALLAVYAMKHMRRADAPSQPAGPAGGNVGLPGAQGGDLGDLLRGALGGVLGGAAAGTVLNGGLGGLLKQLQESGHGDAARSWVGAGPNKAIPKGELANALGADTLDELSKQTGGAGSGADGVARPRVPADELSRSFSSAASHLHVYERLPGRDANRGSTRCD
jgi:uncharacterized protein YidB (DUF937 family)